ncbi:hypothetical protein I316_05783 [Kwoniella heveanensis BCC8398]|uniref:Uncharacterized protein n=1 Tax=Kwoniella heveanensis BCC8398 TaxID=1296120 RepID=A0A1B9GNN8_9TREE|nr:hypothetical protein I316_05783 [Kwoniella heveanensis BCC8398]
MPSTPFYIPDTSPLFSYTPSDAWTAGYRPKGDGFDQTVHRTSQYDEGTTISLNITATALRFHTSAPTSGCNLQYRLNYTQWTEGCTISKEGNNVQQLPGGLHQVELRPKRSEGGGSFEFMGVEGDLPIRNPGSATNLTIDNTSPSFVFSPSNQWTKMTSDGLVGPWANYTAKTIYDQSGLEGFLNGSIGVTTVEGAEAELTFQGEAVYLYGSSGQESGTAEIRIDGKVQQTINMTNPWESRNSLLYVGGGFDPLETHTLSIVNTQPGAQMVIDYALLTIPQKDKAINLPLIVGLAAGIPILLVVTIGTWLFFRRREQRRSRSPYARKPHHPYAFANGIGAHVLHTGSKVSSIDNWQLNTSSTTLSPITPASGTSLNPPGSGYIWGTGKPAGLDLIRSKSNTAPSPASSTVAAAAPAAVLLPGGPNLSPPFNDPPPDYPDYLPYRGPVETPSQGHTAQTPGDASSASPYAGMARSHSENNATPLLANTNPGSSSTTAGWLHTPLSGGQANSPSPSRSSSGRSGSSYTSPSALDRLNPLATSSGGKKDYKPEYDDIALTDYYGGSNTLTTTFGMAHGTESPAYEESESRNQIQRDLKTGLHTPSPASASASASTPSSAGQTGVAIRTSVQPGSSQSVARLWSTRDAVPSAYKTPSAYVASSGRIDYPQAPAQAQTRLVTANTPSSVFGSNRGGPYPPNSSAMTESIIVPPSPASGLSRNMSIKSMGSFFSRLIFNPPGSSSTTSLSSLPSVPSTPAFPQAAARPDSGTLPIAPDSAGSSIMSRMGRGIPTRQGTTRSDISVSSQTMPSTATRSVFGTATTITGTSSPGTARTIGSAFGGGLTMTPVSTSGTATPLHTSTSYNGESVGIGGGYRPMPLRSASEGMGTAYTPRTGLGTGTTGTIPGEGSNFFIELNSNSPMTDSRPGSEWTNVR